MKLAIRLETLTVTEPGTPSDPIAGTPAGAARIYPIRAGVLPEGTTESNEGGTRSQVVTRYRLFFPSRVALPADSSLSWRGLTLNVVGKPEFWPDPVSREGHTELVAQVSEG